MANPPKPPELYLSFHGRILEHMGIQTYQSPINVLAEMVANGWDAEGENVEITVPTQLEDGAVIRIRDDGLGMTLEDCAKRYLQVGWNRRGDNPDEQSPNRFRPILGRKGIGKFAGFGLARVITVETVSKDTGERTVFQLDFDKLVSEEYVSTAPKPVSVESYGPPDSTRREQHGTTVMLSELKLSRVYPAGRLAQSLARRFLLHQKVADFRVTVNGTALPVSSALEGVEFVFPRDYRPDERPSGLKVVEADGWGVEELTDGRTIRWRFVFYPEPIDEEDLRGVAVFAKGKIAQAPFFFNLTGGLGGQHGVEYLSGQVEADFVDKLKSDLIATERLRVNWDAAETQALLKWGQDRVTRLLRIWRERRGARRVQELEEKVAGFSARLAELEKHERRTVESALKKLAQVPALSRAQFEELGGAMLTAYEQGRLRDLIQDMAAADEMNPDKFIELLVETHVLTSMHLAEVAQTKIEVIKGLQERVRHRDLENKLRDHIGKYPWLINAKWDTFVIERRATNVVEAASEEAGLTGPKWAGRVDLVLSSGDQLLVLEFMRPGLPIDWDHLDRFRRYIRIIRSKVGVNTVGPRWRVSGYIAADRLDDDAAMREEIEKMADDHMYATDWPTLFAEVLAQWQDFLRALAAHAPDDERLKELAAYRPRGQRRA